MSLKKIETDFDKAIRELREARRADRKRRKNSKIVWGRFEEL